MVLARLRDDEVPSKTTGQSRNLWFFVYWGAGTMLSIGVGGGIAVIGTGIVLESIDSKHPVVDLVV